MMIFELVVFLMPRIASEPYDSNYIHSQNEESLFSLAGWGWENFYLKIFGLFYSGSGQKAPFSKIFFLQNQTRYALN